MANGHRGEQHVLCSSALPGEPNDVVGGTRIGGVRVGEHNRMEVMGT